jgi:polysaccharide biosynthesis transport protein
MNDHNNHFPSHNGSQFTSPVTNGHTHQVASITPKKLLHYLKKFWWIPASGVGLSLMVAAVLFFKMPPEYFSSGSFWETEKIALPGGDAFTSDRDVYLGTQDQLLRSKALHDLTINRMRALATNQIVINSEGDPLPVKITVQADSKSSVYMVEATSSDPNYTTAFLHSLLATYLDFRKTKRSDVSEETLSSISEEVQRRERDIKSDQAIVDQYERSNNITLLQQELNSDVSFLTTLKNDLSNYQLRLQLLDTNDINSLSSDSQTNNNIMDSLQSDSSATSSSQRVEAEEQVKELQIQRDHLLAQGLTTNSQAVLDLDTQLIKAKDLVAIYNQQSQEAVEAARQTLQIKITNIQKFIKDWETKIADINQRTAQDAELKQAVQRNQGVFERLTAMMENVDISRNIDQSSLAILEDALPAKRSYKKAITLGAGAVVAGLAASMVIIFLLTMRDDCFETLNEVTERFGDSVVGQVPEAMDGSNEKIRLLEAEDKRHMFAESYRNLRSALLYFSVEGRRPQVVLITSAVPAEGKSTIATNLARALALGGSRVLLVDGDMRRGHIHEALACPFKPGLSDLLRQPENSEKFVQQTDLPNFSFIARGSIIRNPGDLLLSPTIEGLIKHWRTQYDFIVIDSSPVFAADDTPTLAPKVDGTLFIVRSQFSNARMVREALDTLFQRQAQVLGLVLNRCNATSRSYYYYKYDDYSTPDDPEQKDRLTQKGVAQRS